MVNGDEDRQDRRLQARQIGGDDKWTTVSEHTERGGVTNFIATSGLES